MDSTWRIGAAFYRDCTPESAARQFAQATYGPKWTAERMGGWSQDLGKGGTFLPLLRDWSGKIVGMNAPFRVEGQYQRGRDCVVQLPAREFCARVTVTPGSRVSASPDRRAHN